VNLRLAVAALLCASAAVAQVKQPESIEALPMAQCTIGRAHAALFMEASYNGARLAEQQMKVLDEWKAIIAKGKDGRPMIETLSKEDMQKWGQLEQRLNAGMLLELIDSRRERDLDVMVQQVKLADTEYRWGTTPREGSVDEKPYLFLVTMRVLWNGHHDFEPPKESPCSFDYALAKLQVEPSEKVNALDRQVEAANAWAKQMLAKYKVTALDQAKLSKDDAATLKKYRAEVFEPGFRAAKHVEDLENLRLMAKASDIIYDADRKDAAIAAGDANVIGTTIQRRFDAGEFDERMQQAIGLWRKINDAIPAPIVSQFKEVSEAVGRIQKKGSR